MSICEICQAAVSRQTNKQVLQCWQCKELFYTSCVQPTMPDISKLPGFSWRCAECSSQAEQLKKDVGMNVLITKLDNIQADIKDVKKQQKEFHSSLEFFGSKIDEFTKRIGEFEVKIRPIPMMQQNIQQNNKEIDALKTQIEDLQQRSRINNLEINGVPQKSTENVMDIVTKIFSKVGITESNLIDACHRIPHMSHSNATPKAIIVKLISRSKKNVLAAMRHVKNLTTDQVGLDCANSKIYINEHLTHTQKILYKKVRDQCKRQNIGFWTRDGKIFVWCTKAGRSIHITDESVLNKAIS